MILTIHGNELSIPLQGCPDWFQKRAPRETPKVCHRISPDQVLKIKKAKSAQRESFGDGYPSDIRVSFARISWPKTSVRALKMLDKDDNQGSPRQTKPKKCRFASRFANLFSWIRRVSGKTRRIHENRCSSRIWGGFVNSPCFSRKTLRIHKNTPNSRTGLRIGLSLVWFAGATPDCCMSARTSMTRRHGRPRT